MTARGDPRLRVRGCAMGCAQGLCGGGEEIDGVGGQHSVVLVLGAVLMLASVDNTVQCWWCSVQVCVGDEYGVVLMLSAVLYWSQWSKWCGAGAGYSVPVPGASAGCPVLDTRYLVLMQGAGYLVPGVSAGCPVLGADARY